MSRPFQPGDRVTRMVDVFVAARGVRHGIVTRRYGRRSRLGWYDPELYDVRFDDGTIERSFFRHGLEREEPSPP